MRAGTSKCAWARRRRPHRWRPPSGRRLPLHLRKGRDVLDVVQAKQRDHQQSETQLRVGRPLGEHSGAEEVDHIEEKPLGGGGQVVVDVVDLVQVVASPLPSPAAAAAAAAVVADGVVVWLAANEDAEYAGQERAHNHRRPIHPIIHHNDQ